MPDFEKPLFIVNPRSGAARGEQICETLIRCLEPADHAIRRTERAGDGRRFASEASSEGFDLLVAVGGDGTLQEVISGAIDAGAGLAVAHAPAGTANAVAAALALPEEPESLAAIIREGSVDAMDVGYLPELDRHFLVLAAAGLPARIIEDSTRQDKDRYGALSYVMAFARNFLRRERARVEVVADGVRMRARAHTVVVSNLGRVESVGITVNPNTSPFDGRLDVCVATDHKLVHALTTAVRVLSRRHREAPHLKVLRAKKVQISATPPLLVQVDGELMGHTPLLVEVAPGAISMVLPP